MKVALVSEAKVGNIQQLVLRPASLDMFHKIQHRFFTFTDNGVVDEII